MGHLILTLLLQCGVLVPCLPVYVVVTLHGDVAIKKKDGTLTQSSFFIDTSPRRLTYLDYEAYKI